MDFGDAGFILAIIALSYLGWMVNNWIRAKNGYALEDEWGGKTERSDNVEARQLRAENAELRGTIDRMEQRMRSLETIVTDKGYGLGEEIERLRDDRQPARNARGNI